MARYETDSAVVFTFSVTFFATTLSEADSIAASLVSRIFGAAVSGLIDQPSTSSVVLSGMDVSGSNYTYNYAFTWRQGDKDNASPIYNTLFAATAADALVQLQNAGQRVTNIQQFPIKVNYLKVAP